MSLDPDGEDPVSLESSASLDAELSVDVEHQVEVEDQADDVLVLSMDDAEPTESSGGFPIEASVDEEPLQLFSIKRLLMAHQKTSGHPLFCLTLKTRCLLTSMRMKTLQKSSGLRSADFG